ncbi:hypothetical protein PoB_005392500 [Plakobranchus ocellatus]|uniref:Uncharacterized protein n=1 Tax=Plakobranchus ocellatus TaxID=259542 RepID=A0AAV4C7M2_9GAST|nr:hypothetical protein PoB_005392500 [Plakobranchus ocellatus]
MLFTERAPSPCLGDGDLSKDFGLDITVSDGGLVTSAANQRQYQSECNRIYQQFILNMTDYISEEAQLKQTLNALQSQQKKSPRRPKTSSMKDPATGRRTPEALDEDAFSAAQMEEFKSILNRESCRSRISHASGFGVSNDDAERGRGGQTSRRKSFSSLCNLPAVNHMFPALKERPPSVKAGQLIQRPESKAASDTKRRSGPASVANSTATEYDGIMEANPELSSNRRIRMNPRAFTKLLTGQVKVKLLNKAGDFVLRPVAGGNAVLAQEEADKQQMDSKERIAIVKQSTSFQSPTLSSDLKISNLVAIQKALKGQAAKRVTVGEVMKSARDRRARIFRVQMSGNRFDDFDQVEEDTGFVHEIKAALDVYEGDNIDGKKGPRPHSRSRNFSQMQLMRQQDPHQRPESRLRTPTPIPLHILDPRAASAQNPTQGSRHTQGGPTPIQKQVSLDVSGLAVHGESSDLDLRYNQAVIGNRPQDHLNKLKEQQKQISVIQLDLDEPDSHLRGRSVGQARTVRSAFTRAEGVSHPRPLSQAKTDIDQDPCNLQRSRSGVFPVSQYARSKSANPAATPGTGRSQKSPNRPCSPPIKRITNMRDTAFVVKRWQDEDKARETKLNRWRMRMSFAATRRGNLAKTLARSRGGR